MTCHWFHYATDSNGGRLEGNLRETIVIGGLGEYLCIYFLVKCCEANFRVLI